MKIQQKRTAVIFLKNIKLEEQPDPTTTPTPPTSLPIRLHVLVIGGDSANGGSAKVEELGPDRIALSDLPQARWGHSAFLLYRSFEVLVCGGKSLDYRPQFQRSCISYMSFTFTGKWTQSRAQLAHPRVKAIPVTMPSGDLYILGGIYSPTSSEIFRDSSSTWTTGPTLPFHLHSACATTINQTSFVAIGGGSDQRSVAVYNTQTTKWSYWPKLAEGRQGHSCAKFSGKMIVAGGYSHDQFAYATTTILIDLGTGSAAAGPTMNLARAYFSMESLPDRVLAIGGSTNNGYTNTTEQLTGVGFSWTFNSSLALTTPGSLFATLLLQ